MSARASHDRASAGTNASNPVERIPVRSGGVPLRSEEMEGNSMGESYRSSVGVDG